MVNSKSQLDDSLDRELKSLKQTISLCNPVFRGTTNDWKTTTQCSREERKRETALFGKTPRTSQQSINRTKDEEIKMLMRELDTGRSDRATDSQLQRPISSESTKQFEEVKGQDPSKRVTQSPTGSSSNVPKISITSSNSKKTPLAKRSNMNGILHGIPGTSKMSSSSAEAHEYSQEMKRMNREKDMVNFRRRDKYSEYVEARVRFSKMHSVN